MATLQQTISKLTTDVWENINLADQLNTKFGEETISDILLLELARLKNYNLRIIQTPKDKEKYKGTDWEWFIGSQAYGWIRFAIQAKKANPKYKGYYSCLAHKVNTELQVDILKKYAKNNNAVPLYSFYNYFPNANQKEHWHCKKDFNQQLLGWTLTSIKNVEIALKTRGNRNFDFLHKQKATLPMKCLFDCPILLRKYQDKTLVNQKIKLFDTEVTKIKSLPTHFLRSKGIESIDSFPEELYNREIEIYPQRIVIFDLGEDGSNFKK